MAKRYYRSTSRSLRQDWTRLPARELLELRPCDLGLEIEGTAVETRVDRLRRELARAGLRYRPYVWLSSDWFTPDGCTGFAIPFVLAHPRLARLERQHMFEVEGGGQAWCMRLLRHETAHSLDNAYRLRRRRRFREVFGRASDPYEDSYVPDPLSRDFVLNLDHWYSQSHPLEDFAETFAVWLQRGWRQRYEGWPALRKLEFVDEMMRQIADRPPLVRTRRREEPLSELRMTLREYFARKQSQYDVEATSHHDRYLRKIFTTLGTREPAASFLARRRSELRRRVANGTGQHPYLVDQLLGELIGRCRQLRLRLVGAERDAFVDAGILLGSAAVASLYGPHPRFYR